MIKAVLDNMKLKMSSAIESLKKEFGGVRTGRASPNLLDNVYVDSYGQKMPIRQVANISIPEPKIIIVQVWDKDTVKSTVKAISDAGLGVNPSVEGQSIRLIMPDLTEEARKDMVKLVGKLAEKSKVSIRNIRRDGMDSVKKMEKNKEITEDQSKKVASDIQKITNEFIESIEKMVSLKEKELMKI